MAKTQTLYEVCNGTFESISGMMASKSEALKDLRRLRRRYPDAHLCKVVWMRLRQSKKESPCK